MRRQIKNVDSKILSEALEYKKNNSTNNAKIANVLFSEQKGFCAYTEEYITRTDAEDIEHFNPTLKETNNDNYQNWFLVKHQWNSEKSTKWASFQPCLHPGDTSFETRILYKDGIYFEAENDIEAHNTLILLNINDEQLVQKRINFINRRKIRIRDLNVSVVDYFTEFISDIENVKYLTAIKSEFDIDLFELIPTPDIKDKKER